MIYTTVMAQPVNNCHAANVHAHHTATQTIETTKLCTLKRWLSIRNKKKIMKDIFLFNLQVKIKQQQSSSISKHNKKVTVNSDAKTCLMVAYI